MRKNFLALAVCIAAGAAQAQIAPDRQISLVVPYPPGGSIDFSMRIVAEKVSSTGGPSVIVLNKAGAGGVVGAMSVKQAPPDGQMLMVGDHGVFGTLGFLTKDVPFEPLRDFAPVALLRSHYQVCALPKELPANTVPEFLALAKKTPGGLSFASQGSGSSGHIIGAMLAKATGAPLVHVPFRGDAPAVAELIAGRVAMLCSSYDAFAAHVQGGQLKIMAAARRDRSALLPDVPTFAESGVDMDEFASWNGLFAPAETPAPLVNALNRMFTKAINAPDIAQKLNARDISVHDMSPADFAKFIADYRVRVERIIRTTGVTME